MSYSNLDKLSSFKELEKMAPVSVKNEMDGEKGADRVKKYQVPMSGNLVYNFYSFHV